MPFGGFIRPNFIPGEFNPNNPLMWEEYVGDEGKREDTVTHGESIGTLRGWVLDHQFVLSALAYWLGYAWVDYTNPSEPRLRRQVPVPHPESNQLFAKRIQIHGWKYRDKVRLPNQPDFLARRLPFARYQRYFLEIDFQMVDYEIFPDDFPKPGGGIISDWERFVSVDPDDATEIATVDGGAYRIKAPGNTTLDGHVPTLHGPMLRKYVERTDLTIRAHQLPYDLLFNNSNIPTKLMKAKGKVNATPFLGINGQCLVLKTFKPKKYPQPVATQTWTVLQFGVDVDFNFCYQEPTKAISSETLAGWNLVPAISTRWDDGWYGCETEAHQPMYPSVNMNNLLTHWSINNLGT